MSFPFKIQLLTFFGILLFVQTRANDSLLMDKLLQRIHFFQSKESSVFPKGMLTSYRIYALNRDRQKADINGFYTGLIAFTLKDIKSELSASQQKYADQIIEGTLPVYAKFQNQKGRNTYNFWPTDTLRIFPNAGWGQWEWGSFIISARHIICCFWKIWHGERGLNR